MPIHAPNSSVILAAPLREELLVNTRAPRTVSRGVPARCESQIDVSADDHLQ
jgi:hypothetical protein